MPQGGEFGRNSAQLLQVQRNGDIGSPRASGSTSPLELEWSFSGPSRPALCGRRPNGGCGPGSNRVASASSFRPRPMVLAAMPVIRDTAAMPP